MSDQQYLYGLGKDVQACRRHLGLSQQQMANRLGIKKRSLQYIESNQRPCPVGLYAMIEKEVSA